MCLTRAFPSHMLHLYFTVFFAECFFLCDSSYLALFYLFIFCLCFWCHIPQKLVVKTNITKPFLCFLFRLLGSRKGGYVYICTLYPGNFNIWYKINFCFHSLACGESVFPTLRVGETPLFPL